MLWKIPRCHALDPNLQSCRRWNDSLLNDSPTGQCTHGDDLIVLCYESGELSRVHQCPQLDSLSEIVPKYSPMDPSFYISITGFDGHGLNCTMYG